MGGVPPQQPAIRVLDSHEPGATNYQFNLCSENYPPANDAFYYNVKAQGPSVQSQFCEDNCPWFLHVSSQGLALEGR